VFLFFRVILKLAEKERVLSMKKRVKGSCTTILVGKNASIDGSTIISRNDDGHEALDPQRFVVVQPEAQPKSYQSVISGVKIDLPENPMGYTSMPNAILTNGIWPAAGINRENVSMSATETITINSRILGVDPYEEGGIGEEDMVTLVLPYIKSAREGVERLGALL
jgi:dipeptidase